MSKFPHETKGFKAEFHEWYNMERPPLPGSFVDSETSLKSIDQVRGRLEYEMGIAEKEHVDLNGKANKALYRASKQKTKADTFGEMIIFLNFELF
ncbi:ion channel POLLUX-like 2 [Pyrus ussuriensis x Pyrus communis]|uniref:Ion channel POLLUX-like 2 n=1 Tax=Pyrus ussuriensis x Pyrus communis TaxID=2448454 RepID=A0A5N5FMG7_9ROSA|nr:ion channel POLLUX-like 2 [Pyrus ussuriensis x Pyrus communis]